MKTTKKIAVITGASSGIGKAIAIDLASQDYHVILLSRNQAKLQAVQTEITTSGGVANFYPLDICKAEDVECTVNKIITEHKRIDVLINNSGIGLLGTVDIELSVIDKVIQTNLLGAIYMAKFVAEQMRQQKFGYIINIASTSGKRALSANGIYAASKYGMVGYGDALFKYLAQFGVKVTNICPGAVATDMITKDFKIDKEGLIQTDDLVKTVNYLLHLGPGATVQEVVVQCTPFVVKETKAITEAFFN